MPWATLASGGILLAGLRSDGVLVAQSWPTVCDSVGCSLPGCSVHGILQARVMEWVAISFLAASPVAQPVKNLPAVWEILV